ncbi:hypothetical protein Lal_00021200, partial [Lupinus albus]
SLGNSSFGSRGRFSLSPLSSMDNLEITPPAKYRTQVKAEDEIFVMNDIQQRLKVMNNRGSLGRGFQRGGRVLINILQVGRGRGQLRPASPSMMPKSEVAQRNEELNPTSSLSMTPKSESESSKWPISAGSSVCGPLRRSFADVLEPAKLASDDWSPLDDDIPIVLPDSLDKAPTRDEVHSYILSTTKCPFTKKRLPVFEAICKEAEEQDFLQRHTWQPPNPRQFSKKYVRRRGRGSN